MLCPVECRFPPSRQYLPESGLWVCSFERHLDAKVRGGVAGSSEVEGLTEYLDEMVRFQVPGMESGSG